MADWKRIKQDAVNLRKAINQEKAAAARRADPRKAKVRFWADDLHTNAWTRKNGMTLHNRLVSEEVMSILQMRAEGMTLTAIGSVFDLSPGRISGIFRKSLRHFRYLLFSPETKRYSPEAIEQKLKMEELFKSIGELPESQPPLKLIPQSAADPATAA